MCSITKAAFKRKGLAVVARKAPFGISSAKLWTINPALRTTTESPAPLGGCLKRKMKPPKIS